MIRSRGNEARTRRRIAAAVVALCPAAALAQAGGVAPAGPEDGGARRWEVTVTYGSLNLRAGPGLSARVLARLANGAVLTNLGCETAGGRAWCEVQPLRGGPVGYSAADYLRPARGPDGRVPTGYDDSPVRAGAGEFDATGELPGAAETGQPTRPCGFGVARGVGGDATVVVTRPDGRRRAVFFVHGEAISADTAEAEGDKPFSARREGDLSFVAVGDERYEIPDATPLGG